MADEETRNTNSPEVVDLASENGTDSHWVDVQTETLVEYPAFVAGQDWQVSVANDEEEMGSSSLPYPVVGIGASAGGLKAAQELLDHLPPTTGMAFVFIWHLDPNHESHLVGLLQTHTAMPIRAIEEGIQPQPNEIYVLLPGYLVRLEGGLLRLQKRRAGDKRPATINIFLRSLAADQKSFSVGVVLSGADADGAEGLKTIKGEGGFALVQSPESATQTEMPRSAIAADHIDIIRPPDALAVELVTIAQQLSRTELQSLERGKTPPGEEQSFQAILQLLRKQCGLEVRQYKPETLHRRIGRRMVLLHIAGLADYQHFLRTRPEEVHALKEDILIGVTRFFRDIDFWSALRDEVLPTLVKDRPPDKPLRVWCAGCSSGEEAYSLAVTILELFASRNLELPLQVFGTDASDNAIAKARAGLYPDTIVHDVSPERLRRYFLKLEGGYQISKRVRDVCIFARQNLCNDPPFSHMDIVSCRNVMIYFNQSLQRRIMSTFHYALDPGGFMLLGMSEGLRDFTDAFYPVDRKHKIYTKVGGIARLESPIARDYRISTVPPVSLSTQISDYQEWSGIDLQRVADRMVLARYSPPALIVDENLEVLQARGETFPLIELAPGTVSWNLNRILRADIGMDVQAAVQRAIAENTPTSILLDTFAEDKSKLSFHVEVLPITTSEGKQRCFLVLFQPAGEASLRRREAESTFAPEKAEPEDKDRYIQQLRHDLNSTRFRLESLLDERDVSNQDLVSANEEIQSANEELQSTNEELETTKEELQSTNEELQTVNDELQQRNAALEYAGNDLRNLLTSVNIPLLILTSDLHIRQFTPPMQKLTSILPSDIGRPIGDIRLHLSVEDLEPVLREVSETLVTHESEVQDRKGRWHVLRVRPYRTADNKIEGLVVVLVDIDQLRGSQQDLIAARDFSRAVLESTPVPLVVLDDSFKIDSVNTAFRQLVQMRAEEFQGRFLPDLLQQVWGVSNLREYLQDLPSAPRGAQFVYEHESTTAKPQILLIRGQCLLNNGARVLLLVIEDVTVQRQAERVLNRERDALQTEVDTTTHELKRTQQELRSLTAHLFTVQEAERQRVARDLHDDIGQRLSVLNLVLTNMRSSKPEAERNETLDDVIKQLQSLDTDVRLISHHLHPAILDDLGLSAALKALVAEFGEREGMPATYVSRNLPLHLSPQPAITALYRITQEALRNVAKHAGITHVKVILEARAGMLHLEVRDFGIGFDTSRGDAQRQGLGTVTMQERARLAHGVLEIKAALGEGTTVIVDVPYSDA